MAPAKVFIGSPGEAIGLATTLQGLLERDASVRVWNQAVFEPNRSTLQGVLAATDTYDFACFLAPPVDTTVSRGAEQNVTRDNVILEYGLFLGRLGPDRVFLLAPRGASLALPSDLAGVTYLDYKPVDADNPASAVLAPVAQSIQEKIKEVGPQPRQAPRRYAPVLERGSVDRVAGLSDAALYFSRQRFGYKADIRRLLLRREVIPGYFYYATEVGAEYWLRMSSNPRYRFRNNSVRLLSRATAAVVDAVLSDSAGPRAIDLISLGSGDGEKDRVLLKGLSDAHPDSLTYYPLDISDTLIVECVRNVHRQAFDYVAGLKTKAIIGDFIDLGVLKSVYEDQPNPNLFSILGNTFGNTDEAKIMNALRDSMYQGDFVLIEINCDVDEVDESGSFLRSDETLAYSCLPIAMVDLEVDLTKAFVREDDQLSVFQCAKSSATYYADVELDGQRVEELPLAYDHRYVLDEFQVELAESLDVEILLAERYGNAAIVLARK
ncbi:MAG: L-histidine N(alpha)-methyltransferase [Solirubrobacteraceae bacterium]|jgi:hypothetical protein